MIKVILDMESVLVKTCMLWREIKIKRQIRMMIQDQVMKLPEFSYNIIIIARNKMMEKHLIKIKRINKIN